jgi:hypothetical protein
VRVSDWEIDEDLVETRVYFEPPAEALPSAAFRLARPSPAPLDVTLPRRKVAATPSAPSPKAVRPEPVYVAPVYVAPPAAIVGPAAIVVPRAPVAPRAVIYTPTEPVDFARHIAARGTRPQPRVVRARSRWTLVLLYATCILGSAAIAWMVTALHGATATAAAPKATPTVSPIDVPHDTVVHAPPAAVQPTGPAVTASAPSAPASAAQNAPTVAATALPETTAAPVAIAATPIATPIATPSPTPTPHPTQIQTPIATPTPHPTPTRATIATAHPTPMRAPATRHLKAAEVVVAKTDHPVATVATGTLDISSKPPCTITIDDRATGMTTPRRDVELPIGKHQVTLTNADEGIQLTMDVVITTGHTTKLIRDFMQ